MKRADLRDSLISTMRHLLDYKENIELQLAEAKKIILISLKQNENEEMRPLSLEKDALWFNYLVDSLNQVDVDIALAKNALSQLGVSLPVSSGSNPQFNRHIKNQGSESLDFSVSREM
ncbi:MAG: hypothetical protein IKJ33_05340 [Clostridia bacterium]|nr:hypothetical protein [Clostridia bacterium]